MEKKTQTVDNLAYHCLHKCMNKKQFQTLLLYHKKHDQFVATVRSIKILMRLLNSLIKREIKIYKFHIVVM